MVDKKMLRIALLSFLVVLATAVDRCKSTGIFTYGKCPNVPQNFTTEFYLKCAALLQFGFIAMPFKQAPGNFVCMLDPNKVKDKPICTGDKVVFDSININ